MEDIKAQLYQMFILGLDEEGKYEKLLENGLGGVIFFTKDIKSAKQFSDLICNIKAKSQI